MHSAAPAVKNSSPEIPLKTHEQDPDETECELCPELSIIITD